MSMNTYIYIHTTQLIYLDIYVCMYACMHARVYIYVHMYINTEIHVYIYICMYIYICIYVCVYICIYIYMYFLVLFFRVWRDNQTPQLREHKQSLLRGWQSVKLTYRWPFGFLNLTKADVITNIIWRYV